MYICHRETSLRRRSYILSINLFSPVVWREVTRGLARIVVNATIVQTDLYSLFFNSIIAHVCPSFVVISRTDRPAVVNTYYV